MEEPSKHMDLAMTFASDLEAICRLYEQAISIIDHDRLPAPLSRALRNKVKIEHSTFRGSSADFLKEALEHLGLAKSSISPEALELAKTIQHLIDRFQTPEELTSILVGIEENLGITRGLLKKWTLATLKKNNNYSSYRASQLKLYFDLSQNVQTLEELKDLETDSGMLQTNDSTIYLIKQFFAWWKLFNSSQLIEESLI